MNLPAPRRAVLRERLINSAALIALLAIGALALMGPSGVLAWGENSAKLERQQQQIAELEARRAQLSNQVGLLDPENVDQDLASELIRRDLNVAHPDDYVIELDMPQ